MGKFNWPDLRAIVLGIVEHLSEHGSEGVPVWIGGWVAAASVRDALLGRHGPQVEPAEFDLLIDELVDGCLLERTHWRSPSGLILVVRPLHPSRTERVPAEAPPG